MVHRGHLDRFRIQMLVYLVYTRPIDTNGD